MEFKTIEANTPRELEDKLKQYLTEGYSLHGTVFTHNGSLCQVITKNGNKDGKRILFS